MSSGTKGVFPGTFPVRHEIPPVYDEHSRILILGSFPSVKSREAGFFYGHPQNRFWKVLAALCAGGETRIAGGTSASAAEPAVPKTAEEKKEFLLCRGIAVWDVIASCEIKGSSDQSIRNVVPNDLSPILKTADIRQIFCNGGTSYKLYEKYLREKTGREAVKLPSTSPANAACSLERLVGLWREAGVSSEYFLPCAGHQYQAVEL
ncbi:MAG: uracil-DNA glycosylase family protein [Lachnospiraceae bacterium]|nr:uracil-DNA glycosylase family protein [Lachnospiraceae bacterium]